MNVTSRLLAFVLALIIGSPTCWCCVPHQEVVAAPPQRACCHSSESGPGPGPSKHQDCPCALSVTKRSVADGKLFLPKPGSLDLVATAWLPVMHLSAPTTARPAWVRTDANPSWRVTRLYQRHRALLL